MTDADLSTVTREALSLVTPAPAPSCREILQRIAIASGFEVADLLGKARTPSVVKARHAAMWAAFQAGLSFSEIGREFGRDHTTVISAVRKVEAERAKKGARAA